MSQIQRGLENFHACENGGGVQSKLEQMDSSKPEVLRRSIPLVLLAQCIALGFGGWSILGCVGGELVRGLVLVEVEGVDDLLLTTG